MDLYTHKNSEKENKTIINIFLFGVFYHFIAIIVIIIYNERSEMMIHYAKKIILFIL
jgi:hypothetical protein